MKEEEEVVRPRVKLKKKLKPWVSIAIISILTALSVVPDPQVLNYIHGLRSLILIVNNLSDNSGE